MLESLCIDLINELFITKYKFLLAMKLNIMLSAKCQNCSKNKVAKDDQDGVSPSTVGNSTPVLHTQEEYNYANFCDLKRKEMRKQRIKKRNFKRLRKYVRDLKEHRAVDYSEGGNDEAQTCGATCLMKASQANTSHECAPHYGASHIYQPSLIILRSRKIRVGRKSVVLHLKERCILKKEKNSPCSEDGEGKKVPMTTPPMEKSRKKKKVDHHIRMLNNELCEYISKDFYPFLSLYNFDKEPLPPKKNRINTLLSKEKMNSVSRNRKKIKGTLRGEYTKGPVLLSSKKLNTHYVKFLSKVRMLIKRAYKGNSGGETTQTQGDDPKYTILKTLLYLKGGGISNTTSCASSRASCGRELAKGSTHRKDRSKDLLLLDGPSEGYKYEVYRAISTIRFLRESLHILRMDTIYIFVFFASYINGILARLQGGRCSEGAIG
ncbi:conserved Plasmodium protein, unknown function [Plasmodium knowlesi strain H]|uniref:Uncharacterized protein n=3 Tax=Plasmodium knowlesi TaxID=5850 RepID=A0A5K1U5H0_PLAKH|nr:conserved Plasmodium protein, unknown function [Plasmodium knowlesi strain H]OTN66114.1 Uncharacterized protein PKNOH_S100056600 [Plasmodium knowlesi]CAA9987923.1 conserved Plasmodium protein, unknown function [Plasmodium knowlesi strain H]SBO22232.1 conserved Plasmodium protein, unknown function [Plasmodium knowlesi strain H]SBO28856.1 conserved Plasmodium protein, unknown function [Plasmodium knowlesi strain H]VVS77397.1 conserved Plasmodium protein, unknown function [Plasmodium knowlesi |eukprot:XP_002258904.1 hypothetical protein, conserved in Plasmodium species [Plasmodium knowlesi strain H]